MSEGNEDLVTARASLAKLSAGDAFVPHIATSHRGQHVRQPEASKHTYMHIYIYAHIYIYICIYIYIL